MKQSLSRIVVSIIVVAFIASCAVVAKRQLDQLYGPKRVVERTVDKADANASDPEFYHDIKPIVDSRCVVCHGCYDAPCQLKMSSFESIDRGASKEKIYGETRLSAAKLTRLSIDASTTEQWRKEGFFPVLNERQQTPEANRQASVMYRMLKLKENHPLPAGKLLPETFDLALNRDQQCSKIEDFASFEANYPLWGMPYGLPALGPEQQQLIKRWLETGAKARYPGKKPTRNSLLIDKWEAFFNGASLKERLMSRYIYEHLFLANIYFPEPVAAIGEEREFFKLVRSATPPGEPIEVIPTRRPFDDPGDQLYYRLQRVKTTVLQKQHMPYLFDQARMERWTELFITPQYAVSVLPGYDAAQASNPFITFKDLPVRSRYEFMLDEAQFTIMGFIKGPVCRGQVALNVINDHFWVVFIDPEFEEKYSTSEFLEREAKNLQLPAENESPSILPLTSWLRYSTLEKNYQQARNKRLNSIISKSNRLNLSLIWDGEGDNRNAALTIFRHFDSSTVMKGLVGNTPKTAWVISYPLLERIHYLLVAGFDVYGSTGHQLLTRLYMDFLRMEGEYNFLSLLPKDIAHREVDFWYRNAESKVELYLDELHDRSFEISSIDFSTDNPKKEIFDMLKTKLGEQVIKKDIINTRPVLAVDFAYQQHLQRLAAVTGVKLDYLPEQSLMRLSLANGEMVLVSLVRNRAHTNVSHLLGEEKRFVPEEQTLTVVEGVVGSYPNVFYDIKEAELNEFVSRVTQLNSEQDYSRLLDDYGVRRTDENFWQFSDVIHQHYLQTEVVEAGLLDFNRLENR